MQKITPFLWFDGNAEEAIQFYTEIFTDSSQGSVTRCGEAGPGPEGSFLVGSFTIAGQDFVALNGGPQYSFTPAISFAVLCETQEELDYYWDHLTEGGEAVACGWLKDKFGLSWQITPTCLLELLRDGDPQKSASVMKAMMQMVKIDIAALTDAYNHPSGV